MATASSALARSDVMRRDAPQFSRRPVLKLVSDLTQKDSEAPVHRMTQAEVTEALSNALRRDVAGLDSGNKRIMAACGCNARTADNLVNGWNAPSALYMLRLMAACPEFRAEVNRMTGQHATMDPRFESDFVKLVQTWAAMQPEAKE